MHVLLAPDHELAHRESVTLEECTGYPLLYQDDSGSMGVFLGQKMEEFKESHEPILISNALAADEAASAWMDAESPSTHDLVSSRSSPTGRLVAIPLEDDVLASLKLSLIISSDRLPTVAVQTMAEHLKDGAHALLG